MGRNAELKAATAKIDPHSLDFLSSHPATPERVRNAQLNARQYVAPGPGTRDKDGYLEGLDGLIFGEDPSEGFVRGRKFLHPKLGFTFTAPEGYALDNTAQAVFGVKDGGEQALRLDVVRVPADQKLPEYLLSGWIENIDAQSVEEVPSTASRPRPRPPRATNGGSGSMPCGSAAKSTASSLRRSRNPRNSTAPRAIRSAASGACRAPKPMPPGRCGCAA